MQNCMKQYLPAALAAYCKIRRMVKTVTVSANFLSTSSRELKQQADVIIITGDAYVDHPSFGAALVGRWLASNGLSVGILPQPDWHGIKDFTRLGRPRLFFAVTAGCVDSLVANTTALKSRRRRDEYSPGGEAGRRPDRACIVYANRVHQAYKGSVIILGGIEAGTRRFAHYDYWDNRVRRSILVDAGADIIAYGMAEETLMKLVRWMAGGKEREELFRIPGIVFSLSPKEENLIPAAALWLPAYGDVERDRESFFRAHIEIKKHAGSCIMVQPHDDRLVIHTPPSSLSQETLDSVYALPFTRRAHPGYGSEIPGLRVVRNSITAHRGCIGDCSFCVLNLLQRRQVISRTSGRILKEARWLARQDFFDGTITDVGGPTANMYGLKCRKHGIPGSCSHRRCLLPKRCSNLIVDHSPQMDLIRRIKKLPGVRHVYVNSGVRCDLVLEDPKYLDFLIEEDVIEGRLSVAPEHVSDTVLRLMRKPPFECYRRFEELFYEKVSSYGKKYYLSPYYISSFPGATLEDAFMLARHLQKRISYFRHIQDFTPAPLTDAACMYHTERDLEGHRIYVAKTKEEKLMQRALIQFKHTRYRAYARKALARLGKSFGDLR